MKPRLWMSDGSWACGSGVTNRRMPWGITRREYPAFGPMNWGHGETPAKAYDRWHRINAGRVDQDGHVDFDPDPKGYRLAINRPGGRPLATRPPHPGLLARLVNAALRRT